MNTSTTQINKYKKICIVLNQEYRNFFDANSEVDCYTQSNPSYRKIRFDKLSYRELLKRVVADIQRITCPSIYHKLFYEGSGDPRTRVYSNPIDGRFFCSGGCCLRTQYTQ